MSASDGPTLTRSSSSRRFGHHNNELQLHLLVGLALRWLLLPSIFAPFVLSGVMLPSRRRRSSSRSRARSCSASPAARSSARSRRSGAGGGGERVGVLAIAGLVYTAASWSLTPSSTHSLDGWRARGDGGVLAACFASFVAWRIALPSHNPAVHLPTVAADRARRDRVPRRRRPRGRSSATAAALLPPRDGGGWAGGRLRRVDATEYAWWFLGLSWPLIRLGMATAALGTIASQYALTDREHHVVASPLALALLLRAVTISTIELIPVAPIIGLRAWANLLCGRAALDSLHANGVAGLLLRPLAFLKSLASAARALAR